ncbi:hypothetical protein PFISCL1PPCAC_14774, partial [Pristionchus fissidentatus]
SYWPRYGEENYTIVLPFEKDFDHMKSTQWMQRNWMHSLTFSILYVVVIFGGRRLMQNLKPFSLNTPLMLWNAALATFSIMGFLRMTPEWVWSWSAEGNSLKSSICGASYSMEVSGFWTNLFILSKVPELVDTVFIVLRKRPLLFLHWYHHITVLVYCWHSYQEHTGAGRWFIWMNYGVHAVMYSYYAARCLKIRTPKFLAMFITILQISQMVVGVTISVAVYRIKSSGESCQQSWENLLLGSTIYFSYFILFCNFFYHTYLKKSNRYAVLEKKETEAVDSTKEHQNGVKSEQKGGTTRRRVQKAE